MLVPAGLIAPEEAEVPVVAVPWLLPFVGSAAKVPENSITPIDNSEPEASPDAVTVCPAPHPTDVTAQPIATETL